MKLRLSILKKEVEIMASWFEMLVVSWGNESLECLREKIQKGYSGQHHCEMYPGFGLNSFSMT